MPVRYINNKQQVRMLIRLLFEISGVREGVVLGGIKLWEQQTCIRFKMITKTTKKHHFLEFFDDRL